MNRPIAPIPPNLATVPGASSPATVLDDWFVAAVLPLEPTLMRLLRRYWRQSDELQDIRQDIYIRIYETAARDGLPAHTPAYVFTCARNLLIDRARRSQVVSIETVAELEAMPGLPYDDFTPEHLTSSRQQLRLLQIALDNLPPRCREVVVLRKVDGLSQKEIAERLGIAEGTVEKHITVGMLAMAEGLLAQGGDLSAAWKARVRRKEYDQ